MDDLRKVRYLQEPASLELLRALASEPKEDLALAQWGPMKSLPREERTVLLEQLALRKKAAAKFTRAPDMLFLPLSLEQATTEILARHKAKRFQQAGFRRIADLCCGLGGDSFFLPASALVTGLDLSLPVLELYRFNRALYSRTAADAGSGPPAHSIPAVQADATRLPLKADAVLLDPARRRTSREGNWGEGSLSPSFPEMERILARHPHAALKLGPGTALPDFLLEYELEFLGLDDECLELVVWSGDLGRKGWVRATELPAGETVAAPREDLEASFTEGRAAGAFLFEPVKALVRSHLFGMLAQNLRLWQIDSRLAYLSGDAPVRHPLLKGYRVVETLPFKVKQIRAALRRRGIGILEIKKRGLDLSPEELRKELDLRGEGAGTLILTREKGRKTAFLCEPATRPGPEPSQSVTVKEV